MTAGISTLDHRELILALFAHLEESAVRYVALHSYESLPDDLPSDLDLAVHPADSARLSGVIDSLRAQGFQLVQCINYAVDGYYLVFLWPEADGLHSLAVDFTFHHREGGLILMTGEELVADRRRRGAFWIPKPETEFGYLLAKKTLKGTLPGRQAERLRQLADELGGAAAERVAARWFGERSKSEVVDACAALTMGSEMRDMRRRFWVATLRRDPFNPLRLRLTEIPRMLRRWFRPVGFSMAVLGPDGAGKSTLVREIVRQVQPAFRSTRIFHWRPFLLAGGKRRTVLDSPHQLDADRPARSVVRLMCHLLDYWFGTLLRVRPRTARAGLVVFDRYFEDMLADPRRYRYGGPMWLVRLVSRLVPRPKLVLVLDASEEIVRTRKQEIAVEEIRRLRQVYLQLARMFPRGFVLDAAGSPQTVAREATRIVTAFMESRLPSGGAPFRFHGPDDWQRMEDALGLLRAPGVASGGAHRFGILPSRQHPRLLLPLEHSAATLRALEIYTPYQRRARILKGALARIIATGSRGWARDRLELPAGSLSSLESLVAEVTGEARPVFALSIGTSTRAPKLTVQVMRPSGQILGYIKFPLTGEAAGRVRHEAATLDRFRSVSQLRQDVPEVLFSGTWHGHDVLFQSAGEGRRGPARFGRLHTQFLERLRRASPVARSGDGLVEEIAARWDETAPALDSSWRSLGREALRLAARELRGAEITCGVWHGDFAPWNTRLRDGRLFVFDWEAAEWDMPIWWDMFHFDLQVACLLHQSSGIDLERLDAPAWNGLYLLYLLRAVARSVEDGSGAEAIEYRKQRLLKQVAQQPGLRTLEAIRVGGRY
jgi:thymidylate kinase